MAFLGPPFFTGKKGQDWQQTIADLDAKAGGVTGFKAQGSMFGPSHASDEKLTICSHQRGDEWGIAGHEITRPDTGEHFEAGRTILEKKIASTN